MRRKKWKFKKLGTFYRSIFETTRLENRCRVSKRKGTRDVDGRMFCTARLIKKYPVSVGLFLSWLALSLSLSLSTDSRREGVKSSARNPRSPDRWLRNTIFAREALFPGIRLRVRLCKQQSHFYYRASVIRARDKSSRCPDLWRLARVPAYTFIYLYYFSKTIVPQQISFPNIIRKNNNFTRLRLWIFEIWFFINRAFRRLIIRFRSVNLVYRCFY